MLETVGLEPAETGLTTGHGGEGGLMQQDGFSRGCGGGGIAGRGSREGTASGQEAGLVTPGVGCIEETLGAGMLRVGGRTAWKARCAASSTRRWMSTARGGCGRLGSGG